MQVLIAAHRLEDMAALIGKEQVWRQGVAEEAYAIADAMEIARVKK